MNRERYLKRIQRNAAKRSAVQLCGAGQVVRSHRVLGPRYQRMMLVLSVLSEDFAVIRPGPVRDPQRSVQVDRPGKLRGQKWLSICLPIC
ncbi:hypothetical protein M406DRAFT_320704 [Cryphonectria parasitica EP155]|uniref:Uncharacterized protein n=1 Tax=Cryphonectria parasitica (strain ATCC 38755 / EP155) TaxID=660469 RepID=A0A9P4YD13_CRYP1|nr:uncharacterized protein M406DRAFT_320704 [Cryphonectria parasitica EP155]KAF3771279.1 hypothetical protein M406DRAFT_320704 [Cryphonectria parasitica EP155]